MYLSSGCTWHFRVPNVALKMLEYGVGHKVGLSHQQAQFWIQTINEIPKGSLLGDDIFYVRCSGDIFQISRSIWQNTVAILCNIAFIGARKVHYLHTVYRRTAARVNWSGLPIYFVITRITGNTIQGMHIALIGIIFNWMTCAGKQKAWLHYFQQYIQLQPAIQKCIRFATNVFELRDIFAYKLIYFCNSFIKICSSGSHSINNKPALVYILAGRRIGCRPSFRNKDDLAWRRIYMSLGLDNMLKLLFKRKLQNIRN